MEALSNSLLGLGAFALLVGLVILIPSFIVVMICRNEIKSVASGTFKHACFNDREVKRIVSNSFERKRRWQWCLVYSVLILILGILLVWGGVKV